MEDGRLTQTAAFSPYICQEKSSSFNRERGKNEQIII